MTSAKGYRKKFSHKLQLNGGGNPVLPDIDTLLLSTRAGSGIGKTKSSGCLLISRSKKQKWRGMQIGRCGRNEIRLVVTRKPRIVVSSSDALYWRRIFALPFANIRASHKREETIESFIPLAFPFHYQPEIYLICAMFSVTPNFYSFLFFSLRACRYYLRYCDLINDRYTFILTGPACVIIVSQFSMDQRWW